MANTQAATMRATLAAAQTRAELGALYAAWIGYDAAAEDPTSTDADIRATLADWIREACPDDAEPAPDALDCLAGALRQWLAGHGLPQMSADDLLADADMHGLTAEHREWLAAFVVCWDGAAALAD